MRFGYDTRGIYLYNGQYPRSLFIADVNRGLSTSSPRGDGNLPRYT